MSPDTIVALSSAAGASRRAVVRLTGPDALRLVEARCGRLPRRVMTATHLETDDGRLPCRALAFEGPASATGEDVAELHVPGSPVVVRLVLRTLLADGCRAAGPGEFTARAHANGKLSLAAAEGVGLAVAAEQAAELAGARRLMAGELARRLRPAVERVTRTLALVETGIDFVEEDVTVIDPADLAAAAREVAADLRRLAEHAPRLERLADRPAVVLAGRPNAGKSTLMNALLGRERAVASPTAGTTRDVLTAPLTLRRGVVELTDAAGLDDTEGELAGQMRTRADAAIESADVLVRVTAADDDRPRVGLGRGPDVDLVTKADLGDGDVSATTGAGLAALRDRLDGLAFGRPREGLALNERHAAGLRRAADALAEAAAQADVPELAAADLRRGLDALGEVLGDVTPDDVLGEIFSTFCVGK